MKNITLIGAGVGVVVVIGAAVALSRHPSKTATEQGANPVQFAQNSSNQTSSTTGSKAPDMIFSDADVVNAIKAVSTDQTLQSGNFSLVSNTKITAGWYIATISPGSGASQNETLILKQVDTSLVVVLGPGTAFSSSALSSQGVPQAVQSQLTVYNDD